MQIEVNDYDILSDEARISRAEAYLHRKAMERIEMEDRVACFALNTAIAAVVVVMAWMTAMVVRVCFTM